MIKHGNRTIKVKKADLIVKIKENKENHVKEFNKAIIAYKEEALKQLTKLTTDVQEGALNIKLDLITPVNNAKNYDNILEMFLWEIGETVELEQSEFQEYVQDTTDFAVTARFSNMMYVGNH